MESFDERKKTNPAGTVVLFRVGENILQAAFDACRVHLEEQVALIKVFCGSVALDITRLMIVTLP